MLRAGRLFAWTSAVLVFVAAGWFALIDEGISVDETPPYDPSESLNANLHGYFDWFDTTLVQERIDTSLAILGFASLIIVGLALRERLNAHVSSTVGAVGIAVGSLLWIVGNVLQLGGHRAAGLMAGTQSSIETTNSILFTVDTIDDWFELFAFAFLGVGVLAVAWAEMRVRQHRVWTSVSSLTALVFLALAGAYVDGNGDVIDPLLFIGGMLLLPAWLILTAERMLRYKVA